MKKNTISIFIKPQTILFIFATYVFIIGCLAISSPQENAEEKGESILKDITCLPPCWNGVIPGKTSKQELMAILNSIAKGSDTIIDHDEGLGDWDDIVSFYLHSQYGQSINFFINEDVVVEIGLTWELYVTLGEVIDFLGEPEWVYPGPGHNGAILIIIYEKKGVVLLHEIQSRLIFGGESILPESEIVEMGFFDPDNLEDTLWKSVVTRENLEKYGYKWDGYGDIDEKYPMRFK